MSRLRLAKIALVLALATAPVHAQIYKVLYNFGSNSGDPTDPRYSGAIAQSRGGSLLTTANDAWTDGLGTAFRITPRGTLTVLHYFNGTDGQAPQGGLTLGTVVGNVVWLDVDAAGCGWFVDMTPWDDSEFTTVGHQGERGRMDGYGLGQRGAAGDGRRPPNRPLRGARRRYRRVQA